MKLNLGCGVNKVDGYVNVDKFGEPDLKHDLETFPWPWTDSSIEEVRLVHVLEHLGREPDVFIGIMRELYRVCAPAARVQIVVPHPRHDHFLGDPTHVRVVTPEVLSLFSRANCELWAEQGAANSPLALYHNVDFKTVEAVMILEAPWAEQFESGALSATEVEEAVRLHNNVVREIRMVLEVVK